MQRLWLCNLLRFRELGSQPGSASKLSKGIHNDDVHAFEKVVRKFVAEANKNPAISRAVSYYSAHTPSFNLTVDREKCKKMGVNISLMYSPPFNLIWVVHL
jgi:HAE1 family hydrophobic/amphiphilic exporter-1